jgi:hypothetical protein
MRQKIAAGLDCSFAESVVDSSMYFRQFMAEIHGCPEFRALAPGCDSRDKRFALRRLQRLSGCSLHKTQGASLLDFLCGLPMELSHKRRIANAIRLVRVVRAHFEDSGRQ